MATWKVWATQITERGRYKPPSPTSEDLAAGEPWPLSPDDTEFLVRVRPPDSAYVVDVEVVRKPDGQPVVVGLAIRRAFPMSRRSEPSEVEWPDDTTLEGVSPRDVRRLPISKCIDIALAKVTDPFDLDDSAGRAIRVPRGRPARGDKGTDFYREFSEAFKAIQRQGGKPYQEIARRKNVTENLVYQWVNRARDLGFLPESSRTWKQRDRRTT